MRTSIASFSFFYGILLCAVSLSLMGGWMPAVTVDQELTVWLPLLIGYGVVAILTFPVYSATSEWKPIFEVSAARRKASRLAMSLAILSAATFLLASLLARLMSGPISGSLALRLGGSLLLLNGTYFAIHWAYRPENIFARSTLILLNNLPLALVSAKYRRNAAKAR